MLSCWSCKQRPELSVFLKGLCAWWPRLETFAHICPFCSYRQEVQVVSGVIRLGYLYGAGVAHFAAMEELPCPGLEVRITPEGCHVEWTDEGPQRIWVANAG